MARYYILAKAEELTPYSSGFPWPYEVALCFDKVRYPVAIAEGVGHGAAATTLTATDALKDQWHAHFEKSKGEWLLPIIRRIASGESVVADEALIAYERMHKHAPVSYEASI